MSELLFLGTGAADWRIEDRGQGPRSQGPGFFRRNSAALLDRRLLLDCGRHIFDFAEAAGEPALYDGVTDILITHSHSDHFCRDSILTLAGRQKLRLGCDRHVMQAVGPHPNIEYPVFEPCHEAQMGAYRVMPVIASHSVPLDADNVAMHYIVTAPDGKTLFYGLDGAWFFGPSWLVMKKYRFDAMVLDCTVGDADDWRLCEHNTIPMLRTLTKGIREAGMLADGGQIVASHMARALHGPHEETAAILSAFGVAAAYDGMKLAF